MGVYGRTAAVCTSKNDHPRARLPHPKRAKPQYFRYATSIRQRCTASLAVQAATPQRRHTRAAVPFAGRFLHMCDHTASRRCSTITCFPIQTKPPFVRCLRAQTSHAHGGHSARATLRPPSILRPCTPAVHLLADHDYVPSAPSHATRSTCCSLSHRRGASSQPLAHASLGRSGKSGSAGGADAAGKSKLRCRRAHAVIPLSHIHGVQSHCEALPHRPRLPWAGAPAEPSPDVALQPVDGDAKGQQDGGGEGEGGVQHEQPARWPSTPSAQLRVRRAARQQTDTRQWPRSA
jgi:hypothetical protein